MPTVKGRAEVQRYIAQAPEQIVAKILPGAGRAAAKVVAEEAKLRLGSREAETAGGGKVLVAAAVKVSVSRKGSRIIAKVQMKGPGAYVAPWLEHGTAAHFIRVDDEQRDGRTAGRINRLDRAAAKEGRQGPGHALKIGGSFVTGTVHHPGASPHPFLRVSLDLKEGEAVVAAQAYINTRVARMRKTGLIAEEAAEQ